MRQLVNSWVEAQQTGYGKTLGQAIEDLNRECGTKLTYSRLAEWRRGKYTPCPEALSEMLYRTLLPWALMKVGLKPTDAQMDALEDLLWEVDVSDGVRNIRHL